MTAALRYGPLVVGLGLIGLGLGALFLPGPSSLAYGVPATEMTWVAAAGLRDLTLGLILVVIWVRHQEALPVVLLLILVVPVGDATLVLAAGQPSLSTLPHVVGFLFCAALLIGIASRGSQTPAGNGRTG